VQNTFCESMVSEVSFIIISRLIVAYVRTGDVILLSLYTPDSPVLTTHLCSLFSPPYIPTNFSASLSSHGYNSSLFLTNSLCPSLLGSIRHLYGTG
jgi:hypothetical protein